MTPARALHPLAWWAWALSGAVAVGRTTNPLVIALLLGAVSLVVVARRDDSPWAHAFGAYAVLGVVIVTVRVVFYVLLGVDGAGPVLVDLPSVPAPAWAVGVDILGPVHVPGLLTAISGGLRLAALVVCFGAANALANPKRVLRSLPTSLHHVGTALVIAVTVTPQLVSSRARVRRAQRLRGLEGRGLRSAAAAVVPVLQDALDHALALAASMDSRGFASAGERQGGPAGGPGGRGGRGLPAALVVALMAAVLGAYALLDASAPAWLGVPVLAGGAVVAVAASVVAGRRVRRTRYRPEPWRIGETLVAACGATAVGAVLLAVALEPGAMAPTFDPPAWPVLPLAAALGALVAAAPAAIPTGRPATGGRSERGARS